MTKSPALSAQLFRVPNAKLKNLCPKDTQVTRIALILRDARCLVGRRRIKEWTKLSGHCQAIPRKGIFIAQVEQSLIERAGTNSGLET